MNTQTNFEYEFWFWKRKLKGILFMLAAVAEYEILKESYEKLLIEISTATDSDKNIWVEFLINGKAFKMNLYFTQDSDDSDMVFIKIITSQELREKLELINKFQELFKEFELELT